MAKPPITAAPHVFYVRPAPGWLNVVSEEVHGIVQSPLQKYKFEPKITLLKSTVKLHRCDWRQGLEVLLRLTTAHDMEWLILESKCTKWTEVDAILERVPWKEILPHKEIPVHIAADVSGGFTTASGKLRENFCKIAGVEHVSEGGEIRFKIELRDELLRVLVSLGGDPLYKRGYKAKMTAAAPLPEHQAAAFTKWVLGSLKPEESVGAVFVPFAGSGTLGFEALIALGNLGGGAFLRKYACELFPVTPAATLGFFRKKLTEKLQASLLPPVYFNDFHPEMIAVLKENVAHFPLSKNFEVEEADVFSLEPSFKEDGKVLVLLNPPYGDRLAKDTDMSGFYERLGTFIRKLGKAHKERLLGGCICPDEKTWKSFQKGLANSKVETHHFTHGGKEMRGVRF